MDDGGAAALCRLKSEDAVLRALDSALGHGRISARAFGLRAFVAAAEAGHVRVLDTLLTHKHTRHNFDMGRPGVSTRGVVEPYASWYARGDDCTDAQLYFPYAELSLRLGYPWSPYEHIPFRTLGDTRSAQVVACMLRVPLLARAVCALPQPSMFVHLMHTSCTETLRVLYAYDPSLAKIWHLESAARMRLPSAIDAVVQALLSARRPQTPLPLMSVIFFAARMATVPDAALLDAELDIVQKCNQIQQTRASLLRHLCDSRILARESSTTLYATLVKLVELGHPDFAECVHAFLCAGALSAFSTYASAAQSTFVTHLAQLVATGDARMVSTLVQQACVVDAILAQKSTSQCFFAHLGCVPWSDAVQARVAQAMDIAPRLAVAYTAFLRARLAALALQDGLRVDADAERMRIRRAILMYRRGVALQLLQNLPARATQVEEKEEGGGAGSKRGR
jgi:hypothetical protein